MGRNLNVMRHVNRFILIVLLMLAASGAARAEEKVRVFFFWSEGCPHCKTEKIFLDRITRQYPQVEIRSFEVKGSEENARLFSDLSDAHGIKVKGVPATFIGTTDPIVGFDRDETTGRIIEGRILRCIETVCGDPMTVLNMPKLDLMPGIPGLTAQTEEATCPQEKECPEEQATVEKAPPKAATKKGTAEDSVRPAGPEEKAGGPMPEKTRPAPVDEKKDEKISLPVIGTVAISRSALPYQTVIIAGLDSFNPCAFFVLFTLLGLMTHLRSRKRLLFVGGVFVFFSGFIYFLFMAAWLNIFLLTGQIAFVTVAAGLVALLIAALNIKDFFFFKHGPSLSIPDSAKPKLFDRMRRLMKATSLVSMAIGTVVLAIAANTYELFCTAGFPMVYTRMLTLNKLSSGAYYLYLGFYNVIYVIPLAFVVLIFAVTLGARKLTKWQGQVLKLLSGMMMLCLGLVLLIRPELLNDIRFSAGLLALTVTVSLTVAAMFRRRMKAAL